MSIFLGQRPAEQPGARWPVEDQVAARHEAAHAAAAVKAGMDLVHVTLKECVAIRAGATARGMAIFALAGGAMAGSLGSLQSEADSAVLKEAVEEECTPALRKAYGERTEWIVRDEFKGYARAFVRDHESDIRRLAVALLERRQLDGATVLAVLGERWRPQVYPLPVRLRP